MERFNCQKAINLMNEARKEDERLQKALDQIYLSIENAARQEFDSVAFGPLDYTLANRVAAYLERKEFTTIVHCMPQGYEVEVFWEEN